jgi:pyrimidine operon attenuation protein/uracil phosphoribosyltransferase
MTMHVPTASSGARPDTAGKTLLDADALRRTLSRIAHEIIEANPDLGDVALVGIQTRGVPLAQRLARLIEERAGVAPASRTR